MPSPTAPASTSDESSRLMTLPREIRDVIYGYLGQDTPSGRIFHRDRKLISSKTLWTHVSTEQGPRAALLRISKQFSSEYLERIHAISILSIQDFSNRNPSEAKRRKLRGPLRHIRNIQIRRICRGHEIRQSGMRCRRWIERLQSLALHPLNLDVVIETRWERRSYFYPGQADLPDDGWNPFIPPLTDADHLLLKRYEELLGIRKVTIQYAPFVPAKHEMLHSKNTDLIKLYTPKVYGTWTRGKGWNPPEPEIGYGESDGRPESI